MQEIMNALRIPYDAKESPPVLHTERFGVAGRHSVCTKQLLPDELIADSWVLRDKENFAHFSRACRARVQLENTFQKDLRLELEQQIEDGPLELDDHIQTIKHIVQCCPSWHLMANLAVKN